ncbi:MAG: argininosuccinate synthase [Bacteroidales bacterium]|nr:argininosuccinate synthase [Bacteroidales bacterium]
MDKKKKVVVAFSGGLDTSYTVMYLAREKGYEVHAACANTGGFSPEQLKTNEENAYKLGATKYVTLDVTQEYYAKSLKYMVYGNVLRNGTYPISVSSERIFQGMAIARYANEIGADAIAHGSTGAGNDQVRFDMTFLVMCPQMEIITLTRDGNLSRKDEVDYLNAHGFNADFAKLKYSYNVGIWGTSICGGEILDSTQGLPETAYLKQVSKSGSEILSLGFAHGELKSVNGVEYTDKIAAIQAVEAVGAPYGIGRDMHVGDTIIGIKGRVGFEAAAPMLIIGAHKFLEKFTLSKWQQYWKDQVANWYGMFLHESQYLEPVMRDIEAMLESSQRNVNGNVTLELRPYGFSTVGVDSPDDLVKSKLGEYGETQKGWTAEEAKGFIKVTSTPLRVYYGNHKDEFKGDD